MMKIKTSELIGSQLDWAVAKCEVIHSNTSYVNTPEGKLFINSPLSPPDRLAAYRPSTDWFQGGPIIESQRIGGYYCEGNLEWSQTTTCGRFCQEGPSKLIAGMRCYVASKLGDEIDIPDELT